MGLHRLRLVRRYVADLIACDLGATAVEYAVILAMLAVAVYGSTQILREPMNEMFATISSGFTSAR